MYLHSVPSSAKSKILLSSAYNLHWTYWPTYSEADLSLNPDPKTAHCIPRTGIQGVWRIVADFKHKRLDPSSRLSRSLDAVHVHVYIYIYVYVYVSVSVSVSVSVYVYVYVCVCVCVCVCMYIYIYTHIRTYTQTETCMCRAMLRQCNRLLPI